MALYVLNNALASFVQADLRKIYPWADLTFTAISGAYSLLKVSVVSPPSPSPIATLFGTLVGSPADVAVVAAPSATVIGKDSSGNDIKLWQAGGVTTPNRFPGPTLINILYDCESGLGCMGRGRFAEGTTPGTTVDAPTDVVLYHELGHAFHFLTNGFSGDPKVTGEVDVLPIENQYRVARTPALGQRGGHGGDCNPGPPSSTSSSKKTGKAHTCFTGDTRITLADGEEKPIELVRKGDFVLGRFGQPNRVIGVERPLLGDRRLYSFNRSSPFITAEHPIMAATGWKAIDPKATAAENPLLIVGRLVVGDVFLCLKESAVALASSARKESTESEFEPISLVSIEARRADPGTPLYNLLLEGDHTYFANGFLVHNKCFIATAVLDTAYAARLDEIRRFRDGTVNSTARGAAYIDAFYSCYRDVGSKLAEERASDVTARESRLLSYVVMSVVSYLTLAIRCPEQPVDAAALPRAWRDFFCEMMRGLECWAISAMPPRIDMPADDIEFVLRYVLRRDASRIAFRESLTAGQETPALRALISDASTEFLRVLASAKNFDGLLEPSQAAQNPLILAAGTLLRDTAIKELERLRSAFDDADLSHIFDTAFVGPLLNFVRLWAALPQCPAPAGLPEAWCDVLACLRGDLQHLMDSILSSLTLSTAIDA